MKTITSAIRPRKRRLTNDSTNAKPSTTLRGDPSKLSISEELPFRHLHRFHSGSTTTTDSITAAEENAGGACDFKREKGSEDLDYGTATDGYLNERVVAAMPLLAKSSSASLYESMHYQPLYEDAGFDGVPVPTIRRRIVAASSTTRGHDLHAAPLPPNAAGSIAEPKGGLFSYFHRLPFHFLGIGRHSSSSGRVVQSEPPVSAASSDDANGQLFDEQYLQEPILLSESMVEPSNSSFFSVDYGLLKRVSSTPGNLSLFRAHLVDPFSHPEFRAPPRYTRHQPVRLPANEPDDTPLYGFALLALTCVLFMFSMYSLVVSKFMPDTGIAFLDAIKEDRYFCLLMPITGLSFTFAVFCNWLGMKLFRHSRGS
ncbi:hypothetical protein GGI20_005278 [Coemansia sp. BCRC 34301]|nr:hypothetical protein GGI20_005278 [Coemansia sp. BCRC 34301]